MYPFDSKNSRNEGAKSPCVKTKFVALGTTPMTSDTNVKDSFKACLEAI